MAERFPIGRKITTGAALFLSSAALSGAPAIAAEIPGIPAHQEPKVGKLLERPTAQNSPLYMRARHLTTQLANRILHLRSEATGVHVARNGPVGRRVDVKFNSGQSIIKGFDGHYVLQVYGVPGADGKIQGREAFAVDLSEGYGPWSKVPWPLSTINAHSWITRNGDGAWGIDGTSFSEHRVYTDFSSGINTGSDTFKQKVAHLEKAGETMNALIDDAVHHQPTSPIQPPYPVYGPPNS